MAHLFYAAGSTPAFHCAAALLKAQGFAFSNQTDLNATHLLLPVPSFTAEGLVTGGEDLRVLLPQLSKGITVIGGNLDHPLLEGYSKIDLLQDEQYLARNAMITAHCALGHAIRALPVTLEDCPVLVIGWGRIGKCLCRLLQSLGADVTLAARKDRHRAIAQVLGMRAVDISRINPAAYRLILNTVPAMVLPQGGAGVMIDLASKPGIGGDGVLWARGLPGKDAPESSGRCIAERIIHLL